MLSNKIRAGIAGLAAATAVFALAHYAAPADAAIGPVQGTLTVTPHKPGYHNVAVFGKVSMTQTEAQGLINSGHKVVLRLWGEDTFSDDLQLGPYNATFYASSQGLEFHKVLIGVNDNVLDEDWGQDELYVGMRLVNPLGGTLRSGETNRVRGHF